MAFRPHGRSSWQCLQTACAGEHEFVEFVEVDHDASAHAVSDEGAVTELACEGLGVDVVGCVLQRHPAPAVTVGAPRYGTLTAVEQLLDGIGPAGRRMSAGPEPLRADRPIMLTEFGGVSFDPAEAHPGSWGYSTAGDADDFERRLRGILDAVHASSVLAGFCYTQLTDTAQETNGLCDSNRNPKLPAPMIVDIINRPRRQK